MGLYSQCGLSLCDRGGTITMKPAAAKTERKTEKVTVEVDAPTVRWIIEKLPWLGYESLKDFVDDAVRERIWSLLQTATRSRQ